ncbi:MAG: hypothetical protein QOJ41_1660 [Acidobacteriaceae bacterium]|jgi:hypothetical protein|nr:hypothetical protein [Acidobacteriaceae bacterium]
MVAKAAQSIFRLNLVIARSEPPSAALGRNIAAQNRVQREGSNYGVRYGGVPAQDSQDCEVTH